jgi:hypothetical protein
MFLGTGIDAQGNFNDKGEIANDVQVKDCDCYIVEKSRALIYRHASRGKVISAITA